jgi:hypothetical protein
MSRIIVLSILAPMLSASAYKAAEQPTMKPGVSAALATLRSWWEIAIWWSKAIKLA